MNNFIREKNGFYNNNKNFTDIDSLYIEKKCWYVLDKASLVGKNFAKVQMITKQLVFFTVYSSLQK